VEGKPRPQNRPSPPSTVSLPVTLDVPTRSKVELFNKAKRAKGEEEVPHPYAVCGVASLTVVAPWVRACQMERTCRWTLSGAGEKTMWDNSKPDGEFVDVPTLQTFASLLSGRPAEGSSPSARRILFLDLHEYLDIESG